MPWQAPYWWESTAKAREAVAQDFDRTVGTQFSRDEIPFKTAASALPCPKCHSHLDTEPVPLTSRKRLSCSSCGFLSPSIEEEEIHAMREDLTPRQGATPTARTPYVVHPGTGQPVQGQPGTSLMQHIKTTMGAPNVQSVWSQEPEYECGKGSGGTIAKMASLQGPNAEERQYKPLESGGDYYGGGGCYYLATAMHHLYDLPIAASYGPNGYLNHAWVHDGKRAYDAYGVHDPAEAPGWNWDDPIDLNHSPEALAERVGYRYNPKAPWDSDQIFDASTFAQRHFSPQGEEGTTAKVAMGEWGPDGALVSDYEEPLAVAYHNSPITNRESIERDGLRAAGDPDVDPCPSVFMTRNQPHDHNPATHDLYEVDVRGLPVRHDPWGEGTPQADELYGPSGGSLYHPGDIPRERIRRLT